MIKVSKRKVFLERLIEKIGVVNAFFFCPSFFSVEQIASLSSSDLRNMAKKISSIDNKPSSGSIPDSKEKEKNVLISELEIWLNKLSRSKIGSSDEKVAYERMWNWKMSIEEISRVIKEDGDWMYDARCVILISGKIRELIE